ncbi:hypothetical protein HMPREF2998_00605 [Corynebacterium sp. HMSC065A05]|nr:hypothetical protein HMPREF2998_00605 [Corynebacterium sp. HMSC065A05]
MDAIKGSLLVNGNFRPIVVNRGERTGRPWEVLAGNHTLMATRALAEEHPDDPRWHTIDCWVVDVDEERATKIVLADNRTGDLGGYDDEVLAGLLETVDHDLDGTGYDYDDLAELLEAATELPNDDADDAPAGEAIEPQYGALAERYGVPPFTVIDTRNGGWRRRTDAWKSLGIVSFEGRADELLYTAQPTKYNNWYEVQSKARALDPEIATQEIEEKYQSELKPYAGANGTSVFNPTLAELIYSWFSAPNAHVLDPWAGGSVRGIVAALTGRTYTGCELRSEQVKANEEQWEHVKEGAMANLPGASNAPSPTWVTGDSRQTIPELPGTYDMIIGCPPYYDLEEYSDDAADLSNMSHAEFDAAMADTLRKADAKLANDSFAVFVVASVRDKDGSLLDMRRCMSDAAESAGWKLINDAILVNAVGTAAVRTPRIFGGTRTMVRVHQEILVYVKGDRKKAAAKCGEPQLSDFDGEEIN